MPLDEYKTQVLLLHSEQSALDTLRSGFPDRYTVHCATSGSEALNTLVATPINVIVTAQNLPGMSGLDALREAKKRSPDTVGILLAGNADSGLEALVGEQEVFQIVHGKVTSDAILKLVDNATRQIRLMALAESANDTAANPDEPATQHIVMETSENGSTIISDGTGRMPTLDPKKVAAAASIGSQAVDVLVLTKDLEFLATIKDSSRGMHSVHYSNTLAQADEAIRKNKIGVAVVDAAMVGEKVEQLTQHLRKGSPRLVAIVAGRRDDGEMLMDLINRGKVYRFLLKPVSPGRARLAVEASVKHHLEAPDAAFALKSVAPKAQPAPRPAAKPVTKPAPVAKPAPVTKPAPVARSAPVAKPAPARAKAARPATPNPVDPPLGSARPEDTTSPNADRLASAFDQDEGSFAETISGLISSVIDKFSGNKKSEPAIGKTSAAVSKRAGLPNFTASSADDSMLRNPKLLGMGAAAIVIIAAAVFWVMGGSDNADMDSADVAEVTTPVIDTQTVAEEISVFETETTTETTISVDALLDDARAARAAQRIFSPQGNNAIELLAAALNAEADNPEIRAELDEVLALALGMAETAILEARFDSAEAALQRVAASDPGNARLPFLTAQLSQTQVRLRMDAARVAIREGRYEDAAAFIAESRSRYPANAADIDVVDSELRAARSEQEVDSVLAKANDKIESGELLSPANDNARYYFNLVLSNDADNTSARQGLSIVASKLALQATAAINNGNLNAADDLLADAAAIDASNSDIATAAALLSSTRTAIVEQRRQAEIERQQQAATARAEQERQAAAMQAETERAAALQQAAAESAAAPQVATTDTDEPVPVAEDAGDAIPPVGKPTAGAADFAAVDTAAPAAAAATPPDPNRLVPVSSLNRIRYVAPKYPRAAQRRNISGWVDVIFTVSTDGSTKEIEVRKSEPGDTFVNAATKAVERWEFEPVLENANIVEKRVGVRMMFALEE